MVILFLVPYLSLSAALQPLAPTISAQLHMRAQTVGLAVGLANAGYAVGTVLAVQLAQLLPQRRLLIGYAGGLLIGSVLAAAATGAGMFIVGHVLQGLCTSMLLIAAAPPLFLGFPAARLRWTAVIFNVCVFGAVAAGPLIGGAQASFHAWRPLFWIVAGVAALGLLLSLLTFQDAPPADPTAPRDGLAIGLAAGGSLAAFLGASELLTHGFLDPVAVVPLATGLALLTALWVYQYRARRPLLTVRALASTIPLTGIVIASCAAAAATSAIVLTSTVLAARYSPLHLGELFVPELAAAILTATAFGLVFNKRLIHFYALTGLGFLAVGIAVLRITIPATSTLTLVGSGLVGVGIGASVTPALFLAGFSLRSASIQRVFAILELLRAVAAFMIAPILLHFATSVTGRAGPGFGVALWICFGLVVGAAIVSVGLYLLGRVRPSAPALDRWMAGQQPAWESPPLLAAIRHRPAVRAVAGRADLALAGSDSPLPRHRSVRRPQGDGAPVLIPYNGSELAKESIAEAAKQLATRRDAIVLTVWRTFTVGFIPEPGTHVDAACADDVKQAAEQTAAVGAELASQVGFRANALAVQGTPAWQTVLDTAKAHDAGLIVLGSHRRAGLGLVSRSVAAEVASRSPWPVLIVREPGAIDGADGQTED